MSKRVRVKSAVCDAAEKSDTRWGYRGSAGEGIGRQRGVLV